MSLEFGVPVAENASMPSMMALSRLLQLASPMLPVGAYCYSQGLEWAIECKDVHDQATAQQWICDHLHSYQARFELPMLYKLAQAWQAGDLEEVMRLDQYYLSARDTAEALAETKQMGYSLRRLMNDLSGLSSGLVNAINRIEAPAFPTMFSAIVVEWNIPLAQALHAYVWGWLENQTSAAMKSVPLGQVAGQTILMQLGEQLPIIVASAMQREEEDLSNFNPLLSIAGACHETQYSRLFRS